MNWWFIIVPAFIIAVISTILLVKCDDNIDMDLNIWWTIGTIILWFFIIIVIAYFICVQVEFKTFTGKYELQKELYSTISIEDNFVATSNIVEINNELFEMQASKRQFGNWSMVPEEVLNFEPIGIK